MGDGSDVSGGCNRGGGKSSGAGDGGTGRGRGATGMLSVPTNTQTSAVRLGAFAVNNAMGDCLPRSLEHVFSSHLQKNGHTESISEGFMPWVIYRQVIKAVLAGLEDGVDRPTDEAFHAACLAGYTRLQTDTEFPPGAAVVAASAWDTTLLHLADAVAHQYKEHKHVRLVGSIIELLKNKMLYENDWIYVRTRLSAILEDACTAREKDKTKKAMLVTELEVAQVESMVMGRMAYAVFVGQY